METERRDLLKQKLKKLVVDTTTRGNIDVSLIKDSDAVIAGEGILHLDSLDALEISVVIGQRFHAKIDNAVGARTVFESFDALTSFVQAHAKGDLLDKFIEG